MLGCRRGNFVDRLCQRLNPGVAAGEIVFGNRLGLDIRGDRLRRLGGLGSLPGAILGALVIGVGEMAATAYIGAAWPVAVPFLVIIVVLITRPQGLLGTRLREDAVA